MTLLDHGQDREVTSPDVTSPEGAPGGRPFRRRALRAGVTIAAALALGWALLLPYGVRIGQDVTPGLPVDAGLYVPEYGENGTYGLDYRHHETVTLRVPIRNRGPLPLTLTAASIDDGLYPLLVHGGDNLPLDIGPWSEGELELELTFDNCRYYHERAAETYESVALQGSVLGRDFEEQVTLAYPVVLHGQVILTCPDRTLRRDDDHPDSR
ncbi:hypothetical protein [Nocardioides stalactiti]|uniref:hypothetical protein n=1 Tax=Nocardioides stalactiti TaxID=2755356 RepID=UPI0016002C84|nr:hypothetical protein [Nocardioides stalactiti]